MVKKYRFTASWCQPCKALAKKIEQLGIQDVTVIDIDTEEAKPLMKEYDIRSVPTIVIANENGLHNKFTGAILSEQAWRSIAE